jgi:tetrahydromethanopterin S-methyltransferase subunit B
MMTDYRAGITTGLIYGFSLGTVTSAVLCVLAFLVMI